MGDKIEWLGELSREQVRDEMWRCSFYVLPSRHETFGSVLLEAMACGKPVVASRCGGPSEIVTDEVGLLCKNEDVEDLADAIKGMTLTKDEFNSNNLLEFVNKKFTLPFLDRTFQLYCSISDKG
ncbi:MAG: glycosyltransferase family 4 protein [Cytophagales bacterium]|nr:glycosyltransferase family 4 protein [Cytophagales bacterium]